MQARESPADDSLEICSLLLTRKLDSISIPDDITVQARHTCNDTLFRTACSISKASKTQDLIRKSDTFVD